MGRKREAASDLSSEATEVAASATSAVRAADVPLSVIKPQEVSSSKSVEKGPAKPVHQMTLDEKLSLLNAFRKIKKSPPKVSDPQAKKLIQDLFSKWVDDTMLQILTPTAGAFGGLSPEELGALKILAQTILQRQNGAITTASPIPPSTPAQLLSQPQSRQGENPNPQNASPMISRNNGLNPGVNVDALKTAQLNFLNELSKMDQEDPDAKWRNR